MTEDGGESDKSSQEASSTVQSDKEGIMFYRPTGPLLLQKRFPQLLTEMLDFIKLHGFAAHVQRWTATSSTCGVCLEDI